MIPRLLSEQILKNCTQFAENIPRGMMNITWDALIGTTSNSHEEVMQVLLGDEANIKCQGMRGCASRCNCFEWLNTHASSLVGARCGCRDLVFQLGKTGFSCSQGLRSYNCGSGGGWVGTIKGGCMLVAFRSEQASVVRSYDH